MALYPGQTLNGGGGWADLLTTGLNIAGQVYQGQMQKKAERKAAKAATASSSTDFPQLGMGLAATGPQRNQDLFGGLIPGNTPLGQLGNYYGFGTGGAMDDQTSSVAVMGRARFPTQLVVYTTPSGRMQVGGYRSIGTPLLWSGDFAAVRRVARVARKLGAFRSHRRPR